MLEDAGFAVSDRCAIRPRSFDLVARRGEELLLVKVLRNVDAFDAETGEEMRRIGAWLDAASLVIGLRTRDEPLKPEVVYLRHGVPVLSPDTALDLFLEGVPPLIYAAPGGLYVSIDSDVLADEREERGWSLGRLANELGVSRRTVSKYEDGMDASIEVAAQLEELFGDGLTSAVDVMDGAEEIRDAEPTPEAPEADPDDQPMVAVMHRAGYRVHPTIRAPFKAVNEDGDADEDIVLTGHSEFTQSAEKRARIMASVGEVAETRSVYFVDSANRDSVGATALIEREEAEDIEDADRLEELIRERSDPEAA
jgi:putative transcriptional regulator